MQKLVIDLGHGGKDPGCMGNGMMEKELVLNVGKRIKKLLADYLVDVTFTRETDIFLELSERAAISNKLKADRFFSVHVNAGGGTGIESFIYNKSTSKITADYQKTVTEALYNKVKGFGIGTHGELLKKENLAVCRETNAPAVLFEIGFIDSKDANLLKQDAYLQAVAVGIVEGLAKDMGLQKKAGATTPQTSTKQASNDIFRVQTGAFSSENGAKALAAELQKKGYPTIVVKGEK
ncbi:N-acetylmuramoyl-L-alanine amidase [Priestia megaterium]